RAYYHPVKNRPNLDIRTRVHTNKVLFDGKRATGVEYQDKKGKVHNVYGGEVISCAGAFNTPQLLQLSGIGNARDLEKLNIPVIADLPGVGENLQDHLEVYVQHACKQPVSLNPAMKWWRKPDIGLRWLLFKKGPASTNHFEAGGFTRSNDEVAYPNLMFHFLPLAVRYDGSSPEGGHGYQVHVGPMYSNARGSVKIKSTDPREHPSVVFNYLSTEQDRREWVEAIRQAREILKQPALGEYNDGEISPGPGVQSDQQIIDWVAKDAETALHPSCTCKMGTDETSVVDPQTMKVHGVEGLRVVDASAIPHITNGNIYAPVIMMAEKASDLILGNGPLPPVETPFYRHG
ncbi:MAG: GMC oxidoreductase, partial [Balneolales bacterium]